MARDLASLFPEMGQNELIYAEFIRSRIQKNGGSLKFQHITGQLSQLEHHVRSAVGASQKDLMSFLKKYDSLFTINDGIVTLKNLSSTNKQTTAPPKDVNINGKPEKESPFPKVINNVSGIVIKVQPSFGFIAIKEPVKTSVYFTPSNFNEATKTLLTDLGIVPGKKVCLNARIGNLDFESKYRATKVWIPENVQNEVLHPEGFHPKVPKTRDTGLYDADTSEGCGSIQKVFDTYGFIIIDGDLKNTVFFHKNRVCNVENVNDLSKIFRPGDLVEYKAVRSTKQSVKVRWEATKVWLRKKTKTKENVESATSDYESISGQSKKSKSKRASDFQETKNKFNMESKEISNEIGKIYPSAKGTVIKFGTKDSNLADADSCLFYLHKVKVEDVSWEFSDGDSVKFDGVKIKSPPGYKALLAWVGEKPDVVPIALGDFSEQSDEDIEDISENESYTPKTSALSDKKGQNVYSSVSSLVSNSSKKSHNRSRSRVDEVKRYSNYNDDSHSVSSNSRSSLCSGFSGGGRQKRSKSRNSRLNENQRHSNYNKDDSHSVSSNRSGYGAGRQRSKSRHSNYNEDDSLSVCSNRSGYGAGRQRSKSRHSNYNEDDSHSVCSNRSGYGTGRQRSKSRNSRFNENKRYSDYNEDDSHSISSHKSGFSAGRPRSKSRNSGYSADRPRRSKSRSSEFNNQRHSNYNEDDSNSVSSNRSGFSAGRQRRSKSRNSRFDENQGHSNNHEDDSHSFSNNSRSGYSGGRQQRSKSGNFRLQKSSKSDSAHSSHSQLSNCRSKASSRESLNSLSSDTKNKLKPNPDLYKSWGDTPYPDADDDVEISKFNLKAHGRESIERKTNKYSSGNINSAKSGSSSDEQFENKTNSIVDNFDNKKDSNAGSKVSDKRDELTSAIPSRYAEIFLSDEDFSDALEEIDENTVVNNGNGSIEEEETQPPKEDKPNSYIKRFQDLDGLVKKVFCRYAEIENDKLKKPGTFFWDDMFHNGVPVPDKFDDLKEVLSHGQTVKFNCFEIVDDASTYFLKVTMAWKGSKPKITEMTPEEFIAQNRLSFSGTEISTSEDLVESNCSESMRPLNAESAVPAAPRKFLTVASMSDDSDDEKYQPTNRDKYHPTNEDKYQPTNEEKDHPSDEENGNPNSCADSQDIPSKEDRDFSSNTQEYTDLRENLLSNSENMDIPQVTDAISSMLESFKNSQIDSNVVASDLVNIILSTVGPVRNQNPQVNSVPSVESAEATRRPEMTTSYAQTIITGKIFSESIFTH